MRIFFIDHCARLSGAQLSLLTLIEDLVDRGHSCIVALAEAGPLVELLRQAGAEVQVFSSLGIAPEQSPVASPLRTGKELLALIKFVRLCSPDVVNLNSAKVLLAVGPILSFMAVPTVWSIRDIVGRQHFGKLTTFVIRKMALTMTAAVGNSSAALASVRTGQRKPLDAVIYPGIGDVRARAKRQRSLTVKVVIVGRIAEWKGQLLLVRAIEAMRLPVELDIVGAPLFADDDYDRSLRRAVERSSALITLRGFRHNPGDWLHEYDILVHASTKPEAFGRVIVEGMKAGLAVVAAAEGGPSELVTNEVTGLLLDIVDQHRLTSALDRLVSDSNFRLSLGEAAAEAGSAFTRERQVAGYLRVYESLARSTNGRKRSWRHWREASGD